MNKEVLESCLVGKTKWAGSEVIYYDITDSTNVRAWQEVTQSTGNGALFVTNEQIQGKGRRGRSWESPAGKNLYFSLVLRSTLTVQQAPMVTLVMALSVARVLACHTRLQTQIKWPNDIVIQGKKVCGILTEMKLQGDAPDFIVIGVGVNVLQQSFDGELADKAADLESLSGRAFCREGLLADILAAFEADYRQFADSGDLHTLKQDYEAFLVNKDRKVQVLDPKGAYDGIAKGITDTGELLVERQDGSLETVYAGEVSVRGIYGYV